MANKTDNGCLMVTACAISRVNGIVTSLEIAMRDVITCSCHGDVTCKCHVDVMSILLQIDALRTGMYSSLDKIKEIHHTLFVTGKYDRLKKHNYDTSPYTWLKPGT